MPIPVNNTNALALDQKLVSASVYNTLKDLTDYAGDFSQEFQAPINGQRTSTVIIRLRPTVTFAATPASRDGLLPRTGASATTTEITLTGDDYAKVGVDTMGVAVGATEAALGEAIARGIVGKGNSDFLGALETGGTAVEFPGAFGTSTTGQQVWDAVLGLYTTHVEAERTDDLVLYVAARVWAKLLSDVAVLRSAQDPRESAANLLGIDLVRVVKFPTSTTLAVLGHRAAAAQARVLSGVQQTREDWDDIIEARIKYGSKIIEGDAVQVLKDAAA